MTGSEPSGARRLRELLTRAAARWPAAEAVRDAATGQRLTYAELDDRAAALAARLATAGVRPGDRVAVRMPKSVPAVVAIHAALRAGAAYVPLDAAAPAARNDGIVADAGAAALVTAGSDDDARGDDAWAVDPLAGTGGRDESLAYLLFTSGSTGAPKGVAHTHASALSFVDWAARMARPEAGDRMASVAPLHFDLSIFDLYLPPVAGGALVLFDEALTRYPPALAEAAAAERISVWYSTPSTLRLLLAYGRMERHDWSALRLVAYAGEVFAANHLAALKALWPRPRFVNLYGPTETNVCTWFEVPEAWSADRVEPFPIGRVCDNDEAVVIDPATGEVVAGPGPGELCVRGGSVMAGYWRRPDLTEAATWTDPAGRRWHRTGDLVRVDDAGDLVFLGRIDRMVKRHGFRIELGEIEAAVGAMDGVSEAAVVAVPHPEQGVEIRAYVTTADGRRPSLVAFKTACARRLPASMIPDRFDVVDALPRTATGKIDHRALEQRS